MAAFLRSAAQLRQEPGLADARLPFDDEAGRRPGREGLERGVELLELGAPPHDQIGAGGNGRDREHTRPGRTRQEQIRGVIQ